MFDRIKIRVEKNLPLFLREIDKTFSLRKISPLLFRSIEEFVLREGKRIRPILFVLGYQGYRAKPARGLYSSALAIELLHDFMLVHDDIIDKSDMRRNKPSMHAALNAYLKKFSKLKFNGQDLAIVVGDVMYATAIHAFLSIDEEKGRKERALKKFIEAALYTGSGEFIELLCGTKPIETVTRREIYRIYDFKTAYYTFACPLSTGAILAGAGQKEIDKLFRFGTLLGRAFQIKDDILGMFGEEEATGKSSLTDLKEAKKTLLIWYAYRRSTPGDKRRIKQILEKNNATRRDLIEMRRLIRSCGGLEAARQEVSRIMNEAIALIASTRMSDTCKKTLAGFARSILGV